MQDKLQSLDPSAITKVFRNQRHDPGRLIAVCGFDGSGKTTQIEALSARIHEAGHEVLVTRQPTDWYRNDATVRAFLDHGSSPDQIRVMALLAAADRLRHVAETIDPALKAGKVVICDRYVFATIALFSQRGLDLDFLVSINHGIPQPDLAIYLDVPTPVLLARLESRDGGRLKFEERSSDTVDAIKARYAAMRGLLVFVDGMREKDAITADILARACL